MLLIAVRLKNVLLHTEHWRRILDLGTVEERRLEYKTSGLKNSPYELCNTLSELMLQLLYKNPEKPVYLV